jgi:hypothetical protein
VSSSRGEVCRQQTVKNWGKNFRALLGPFEGMELRSYQQAEVMLPTVSRRLLSEPSIPHHFSAGLRMRTFSEKTTSPLVSAICVTKPTSL